MRGSALPVVARAVAVLSAAVSITSGGRASSAGIATDAVLSPPLLPPPQAASSRLADSASVAGQARRAQESRAVGVVRNRALMVGVARRAGVLHSKVVA